MIKIHTILISIFIIFCNINCNATNNIDSSDEIEEFCKNETYKLDDNNLFKKSLLYKEKNFLNTFLLNLPEFITECNRRCLAVVPIFTTIAIRALLCEYFTTADDDNERLFILTTKVLIANIMISAINIFYNRNHRITQAITVMSMMYYLLCDVVLPFYVSSYLLTVKDKDFNFYNLTKLKLDNPDNMIAIMLFPLCGFISFENCIHNRKNAILMKKKNFNKKIDYETTKISDPKKKIDLLLSTIKNNSSLFINTSELLVNKNDKFFNKFYKWIALHTDDISLQNLFNLNNITDLNNDFNIIKNCYDRELTATIKNIKEYDFGMSNNKMVCIYNKTNLAFILEKEDNTINIDNIAFIFKNNGDFLIEISKKKYNEDITNDYYHLGIINKPNQYYFLLGINIFKETDISICEKLSQHFFVNLLRIATTSNMNLYNKSTLIIKFNNVEQMQNNLKQVLNDLYFDKYTINIYTVTNLINTD